MLVVWALAAQVALSVGWPNGAPCSNHVLTTLKPQHQGGTNRRPPFKLRVRAACYKPGMSVQVELRTRSRSTGFKGFVLQARPASSVQPESPRLGFFLDTGDHVKDWKYQCQNDKTSVTHTDRDTKASREFFWTSQFEVGAVRFVATVVQSYSTFFVGNVISRPLKPCSQLDEEEEEEEEEEVQPSVTRQRPATRAPLVEGQRPRIQVGRPSIRTVALAPSSAVLAPGPAATAAPPAILSSSFEDSSSEPRSWEESSELSAESLSSPKLSLKGLERELAKGEVEEESEEVELVGARKGDAEALCEQPAHPGEYCEPGYQHLWYFHKGHCFRFWYSGCKGNQNRFFTKTDCLRECHPKYAALKEGGVEDPRQNCLLPPDQGGFCPGVAQEWQERWHFDEGKCRVFFYAGCHGNPNRFRSEEACLHACDDLTAQRAEVISECSGEEDVIEHCASWVNATPGYCNSLGAEYKQVVADYCKKSCCQARALERKNRNQ